MCIFISQMNNIYTIINLELNMYNTYKHIMLTFLVLEILRIFMHRLYIISMFIFCIYDFYIYK